MLLARSGLLSLRGCLGGTRFPLLLLRWITGSVFLSRWCHLPLLLLLRHGPFASVRLGGSWNFPLLLLRKTGSAFLAGRRHLTFARGYWLRSGPFSGVRLLARLLGCWNFTLLRRRADSVFATGGRHLAFLRLLAGPFELVPLTGLRALGSLPFLIGRRYAVFASGRRYLAFARCGALRLIFTRGLLLLEAVLLAVLAQVGRLLMFADHVLNGPGFESFS